jgi:hypothetical protein
VILYGDQPLIPPLIQAYGAEVLDRLPNGIIYPKVDPEDAHTTLIEATPVVESYPPLEEIQDIIHESNDDGMPERVCRYVEAEIAEEMSEYDDAVQRRLKTWKPFDLAFGEECILGEDGVLLSVGPQERLAELRRESVESLGLPVVEGVEPWKHATLAYSYASHDTSEARRIIQERSLLIPSVAIRILGIYSVLEYSNGQSYKVGRRKLLRFGGKSI